ncbi:hypothetical protein DM01DRAFT_324342 [Hesseltinella vesiculosa]|uniref:Uncharacterized protein n=1 Tax=Hesseltinella vesiculosa TaxID=101127 RepID=A0A1X2G375_9FUNG|nr:hypothetical protein DM01DRAFT_324342 [Hesseltinella vesiculosa]
MNASEAHLLPFKVFKEEYVEAEKFLAVADNDDQENISRSMVLVGRTLKGIALAPSCPGYVWEEKLIKAQSSCHDDSEDDASDTPQAEICKYLKRKGNKIVHMTLWNKDVAPSTECPQTVTIQSWMSLAEIIHQPIPLNV